MRLFGIIFLALVVSGCASTGPSYQSRPSEATFTPEGKRLFVMRENGYESTSSVYADFCSTAGQLSCSDMDYETYKGMSFYYDETQLAYKSPIYEWAPVVMENGARFFHKVLLNSPSLSMSHVMTMDEYLAAKNFISVPIIPGASVEIVKMHTESAHRHKPYELSTGDFVSKEYLDLVFNEFSKWVNGSDVADIIVKYKFEKDEIDNLYIFEDGRNSSGPGLNMRILYSDGVPLLAFRPVYRSDSWIFADRITLSVSGDEGQIKWDSSRIDFERDNALGKIWEWQIYPVTAALMNTLKKAVANKNATVRFRGKYYYDYQASEADIQMIADFIALNEVLKIASPN